MFQTKPSQRRAPALLNRFSFILLLPVLFSLACSGNSVIDDSATTKINYRPPSSPRGVLDSSVNEVNLPLLGGGNLKFGDLVGKNKVVLVNFWATWCGPCRREIPHLTALHKQFKDKGVEIIGLTIEDEQLEGSRVEMFVRQFSMDYRIGFSPRKMFFLFNNANGGNPTAPIPQTFIFGKDGRIVDSVPGLIPNFREWAEGAISYALSAS
jgi:thiol-disulfide isomerase/thioredoxin